MLTNSRIFRWATIGLIIASFGGIIWYKFLKDRPKTDDRLLGAWESAVELTLLDMESHRDLSPEQRDFWRDTLSATSVHYYPTYISLKQKATGQRLPYEVVDKDDDRLTLRVWDGDQALTYPLVFEENNQIYWRPLAEGSDIRQYFRRIEPETDGDDQPSPLRSARDYPSIEEQIIGSHLQE